ncbi:hypothetical protein BVG93_06460 [Serratia marcescens]|nr:hypothetical protein BVG93_06460 [Serratia marcescens]
MLFMFNNYFFDLSRTEFLLSNPLKENSSFLPVTVIFAIILFIVKEVVEAVKKYRANKRKLIAMKNIISRECERNLWTIKSLKRVLDKINSLYKEGNEVDVSFVMHDPSCYFIYSNEKVLEGGKITEVHMDVMEKNLMEAAVLSKPLYEKLEKACDYLLELEHVRDSFLNIKKSSEEYKLPLLTSLPKYGLAQLSNIEQSLNDLYKYCTGNELKNARLR